MDEEIKTQGSNGRNQNLSSWCGASLRRRCCRRVSSRLTPSIMGRWI